jgi:hypothetical protein
MAEKELVQETVLVHLAAEAAEVEMAAAEAAAMDLPMAD